MTKKTFHFHNSAADYYFAARFSRLKNLTDKKNSILITDEHVFSCHEKKFRDWNTIVVKAGEAHKVQATVDAVIEQLIGKGAGRGTTLVGVGGGVITDLTGYIASIYMRGIPFGFVPTSLLAMVDASIGGKNGIDTGVYKNMVGTVRQPAFILYDINFLSTLPEKEWRNGFAEIIKHAAIGDQAMFRQLEKNGPAYYRKRKKELEMLIQRNVLFKTRIVQQDEFEKGDRKLLNFGHTLGHALENQYGLSHGEAIAIGMAYAALLSQKINGFKKAQQVKALLESYHLPVHAEFDRDKVIEVLKMDKKKTRNGIHFILLEKIGKALIREIAVEQLYQNL
jgi:3-dehydroquinate synthase